MNIVSHIDTSPVFQKINQHAPLSMLEGSSHNFAKGTVSIFCIRCHVMPFHNLPIHFWVKTVEPGHITSHDVQLRHCPQLHIAEVQGTNFLLSQRHYHLLCGMVPYAKMCYDLCITSQSSLMSTSTFCILQSVELFLN